MSEFEYDLGRTAPAPERWLVVCRALLEDGSSRLVFVRWPEWPYPALLSIAPPMGDDTVEDAVGSLLQARLHLEVDGPARVSEARMPVRMPQPRFGLTTTGWLRAVAVDVVGTPEPDALLDGFEVLMPDEAMQRMTTELERAVLRMGLELFAAETTAV